MKLILLAGKFFAHEHAHGISASADHKVAVTCLSGAVYVLNENGKVIHRNGKKEMYCQCHM